eukprot:scaffold458349_cov19-Prasinocladus_malaysianus.AAC.1
MHRRAGIGGNHQSGELGTAVVSCGAGQQPVSKFSQRPAVARLAQSQESLAALKSTLGIMPAKGAQPLGFFCLEIESSNISS